MTSQSCLPQCFLQDQCSWKWDSCLLPTALRCQGMGIWLWVVSEGSVSVCTVLLKSTIYGNWFLFLLLCPSGKISLLENTALKNLHNQPVDFQTQVDMNSKSSLLKEDIYQELHLRGYNYGPTFQGVLECNSEGKLTFYRRMMSMVIAMMDIWSFNSIYINGPCGYVFLW